MKEQANDVTQTETLYVLLDDPEDVEQFGSPKEIDAERLGEQLKKFTSGISRALSSCVIAGEFPLTEIELKAKLTTEFGFILVSKAGVEGAVTLRFTRADSGAALSSTS